MTTSLLVWCVTFAQLAQAVLLSTLVIFNWDSSFSWWSILFGLNQRQMKTFLSFTVFNYLESGRAGMCLIDKNSSGSLLRNTHRRMHTLTPRIAVDSMMCVHTLPRGEALAPTNACNQSGWERKQRRGPVWKKMGWWRVVYKRKSEDFIVASVFILQGSCLQICIIICL